MVKRLRILIPAGFVLAFVIVFQMIGSDQSVQGSITLDDVNVSSGQIRFIGEGNENLEFSAAIQEGRYSLKSNETDIAGPYKVIISVHFAKPEDAGDYYSNFHHDSSNQGSPDARNHQFSATLKPGRNILNYNIELPE